MSELDKCVLCRKATNPNSYYGAFCDDCDPKNKPTRTIEDVKLESDTPILKYIQLLRDGRDYMGVTSQWIGRLQECKLTRFAVGQVLKDAFRLQSENKLLREVCAELMKGLEFYGLLHRDADNFGEPRTVLNTSFDEGKRARSTVQEAKRKLGI